MFLFPLKLLYSRERLETRPDDIENTGCSHHCEQPGDANSSHMETLVHVLVPLLENGLYLPCWEHTAFQLQCTWNAPCSQLVRPDF